LKETERVANLRETLAYEPVELNFGTSGLRGLVTDMTDLECYINVAGFLAFMAEAEGLKAGETVYVGGDLRDSTPRITQAVAKAVADGGYELAYCGLILTPALALRSMGAEAPGIMVTGSHIPADRNGIKFYKRHDEVLKADEGAIKAAVARVRSHMYGEEAEASAFDAQGAFKDAQPAVPEAEARARTEYLKRYMDVFDGETFKGKKVVFYQHSAVGRDLLVGLFEALGAEVVPVGRSEKFIPIDSENVTKKDEAYFRQLAEEHEGLFAIVSTDGDSDRPFVIDEHGVFHRGDVLGAVVAQWLGADFAAFPVSSSDAVTQWLEEQKVGSQQTRIGSPYVISAMKQAAEAGKQRVVGWEVNGGFMTGVELEVKGAKLPALPTRDAALPIIVALVAAVEAGKAVSEVFTALPQRFTQAGLIDDFPVAVSQAILKRFAADDEATRQALGVYFSDKDGFSAIKALNFVDGVRIVFENGDIAHLRPSGNAPQLRIYSVADSQERADEIVALALAEPEGIFRRVEKALNAG
jgi:phosphomannomutase